MAVRVVYIAQLERDVVKEVAQDASHLSHVSQIVEAEDGQALDELRV